MKLRVGFTLVELLVVIVITSVLVGLFLPAVQAARAAARKLHCSHQLKQIGLALHNYNSQHDQFPPSKWGNESSIGHHLLSFILPELEQQEIYSRFDFSKNWEDNSPAYQNHLSMFHCPDAPREHIFKKTEHYVSDYAVAEHLNQTNVIQTTISGEEDVEIGKPIKPLFTNGIVSPRDTSLLYGILQPVSKGTVSTSSVTDGLSNTIMLMECAGRPFRYKNREQLESNSENTGSDWASHQSPMTIRSACGAGGMQLFNCNNCNNPYSFHSGGSNFLYGDGSVHFLVETIHPEAFLSLFTAFAGDLVPTP
jgi:prepilin-type N-terminal cleavage/methylation domain-containing protein/prepilin-type processing-associated H-X9-DG protein